MINSKTIHTINFDIGYVKSIVKAFLDAKVLDPSILFVMITAYGPYPIVLLHKNIKKHLSKFKQMMTSEQYNDLYDKFMSYDINWLMAQDNAIQLKDKDGNYIGTPIAKFLNWFAYSSSEKAEEDPDSMRIDLMSPIEVGEKLIMKYEPDIDGYVIISETKHHVCAIFGNTYKMLKMNESVENDN